MKHILIATNFCYFDAGTIVIKVKKVTDSLFLAIGTRKGILSKKEIDYSQVFFIHRDNI